MWKFIKPRPGNLWLWQLALLVLLFVFWHVMTKPGLVPHFMFANDRQAAFFFGDQGVFVEHMLYCARPIGDGVHQFAHTFFNAFGDNDFAFASQ